MVDVAVGIDHGAHPALAAMGPYTRVRRPHTRWTERVDHDHSRLALHESDVGDVIAPHLVDGGHDLEQAVHAVELGHAPQAGMDRVRSVRIHESVAVHVPHGAPALVADDELRARRDQSTPGVLEVLAILEGQAVGRVGEDFARVLACRTRIAHAGIVAAAMPGGDEQAKRGSARGLGLLPRRLRAFSSLRRGLALDGGTKKLLALKHGSPATCNTS